VEYNKEQKCESRCKLIGGQKCLIHNIVLFTHIFTYFFRSDYTKKQKKKCSHMKSGIFEEET
jgi:hypothetical protein